MDGIVTTIMRVLERSHSHHVRANACESHENEIIEFEVLNGYA